jgi:tRNA U34 5-carboxymethylaminomethyl modifying GTPase MnmE/TrmE
MNYQELLQSLGQKLAMLTQSRADAVVSMLHAREASDRYRALSQAEEQAQQRIAHLNTQLIEIGVALSATARAANADLRTP